MVCRGCGIIFSKKSDNQKYCSTICGDKHRRNARKSNGLCVKCCKPTEINAKTKKPYTKCKEHRKKIAELYKKNYKSVKIAEYVKICIVCNDKFTTKEKLKKICSAECSYIAQYKRRISQGLCSRCGNFSEINPKTQKPYSICKKCEHPSIKQLSKLKKKALSMYGHMCKNCGINNEGLLTIDHIKNDGKQHRCAANGSQSKIYSDVTRKYQPDKYMILCMNCNWHKGVYGYLPKPEFQYEYEDNREG